MALFPQSFLDDLRAQADIVRLVEAVAPLKKAGVTYKGLCPFHAEKTPSFTVNRERAFFHCFGCGVGGDVFKFVELSEGVGFQDAVRRVAERFGVAVPEAERGHETGVSSAERETLLRAHELAAAWFREQLTGAGGARARRILEERGLRTATIDLLGFGFAPPSRDALKKHLAGHGVPLESLLTAGLVTRRDDGQTRDRFRNRLIVPICRESGSVIAFAGRAMDAEQGPKYLNSPETPLYTKGRTVYGLHLSKGALRRVDYAVLVEGYFDFAQAVQAGIQPVVATCGTALTAPQARLLRRHVSKAVLSYDPDAAGEGATARSCDLLVAEGFQVNVALLPRGEDPDLFIRRHGGPAYAELLKSSRPYLDFLLDRAARRHNLASDAGRRAFLNDMLEVAARIPDAPGRDRFADRLAHRATVTEEVVRAEIRKAAVERRRLSERELPAGGPEPRTAEKGLIWALMHAPAEAVAALSELTPGDLAGLRTGAILLAAQSLHGWPADRVPETLLERLTSVEGSLVRTIASLPAPPAGAADSARALQRLRCERERLAVQREIDHLQQQGGEESTRRIDALWARKKDLTHQLEALNA